MFPWSLVPLIFSQVKSKVTRADLCSNYLKPPYLVCCSALFRLHQLRLLSLWYGRYLSPKKKQHLLKVLHKLSNKRNEGLHYVWTLYSCCNGDMIAPVWQMFWNICKIITSECFHLVFCSCLQFHVHTYTFWRQLVCVHHGLNRRLQPFISGAQAHHFTYDVYLTEGCVQGVDEFCQLFRAAVRMGCNWSPKEQGDNMKVEYGGGCGDH